MHDENDHRDGSAAGGLVVVLAALLAIAVLGFYFTGPVNQVSVLANAPPAEGTTIGQHR